MLNKINSVSLQNVLSLPQISAIYIVMSGDDCLYVGLAKRLKKRWMGSTHHKIGHLNRFYPDCRIHWIETPEHALKEQERHFIHLLTPRLNGRGEEKDRKRLSPKEDRETPAQYISGEEYMKAQQEMWEWSFPTLPSSN